MGWVFDHCPWENNEGGHDDCAGCPATPQAVEYGDCGAVFKWVGDPNTVTLVCASCGVEYDEADQVRCQEWIRSGLEMDVRAAMIRGWIEYGECDTCDRDRAAEKASDADYRRRAVQALRRDLEAGPVDPDDPSTFVDWTKTPRREE